MFKSNSIARGLVIGLAAFGLVLAGTTSTKVTYDEPLSVYASQSLEDDLSSNQIDGGASDAEISADDQAVGDWISNQRGMTGEQLQTASETLSPLTNAIGYLVGGIVVLIMVLVTLITALDLLYISFPPVRNLLYKAGTDGTGAYTGGMPGGGYGRGMMGMGMGGMGGAAGGTNKPTQWVSDEAVTCAALIGGSAQSQGGMPGMGMGGYGMQQPQQQMSTRSVIGMYFKKRIFFLILLVIAVMILTSSAIMGTGVNLAQWGIKLIQLVNGYIPN